MKYAYILILFTALSFVANAQSFSDDFESYTVGSKLAANSSVWKTWTLPYTSNEDVTIVNTNASSGSNSIYFASTNGGPTDMVLPFNGEYNTGTFNIEMNLNVASGKQGYFNLQKTATVGQIWAMDVTFKNNGIIEFTNNGALLFTTNYTQGSWFNFKLSVNLNNSEWTVYINGNNAGTFQNTIYQIASMNIYAIQNSAFWVDDVAYDYTPYSLPTLNASLAVLSVPDGLVGQSVSPKFTIRNLGTETITSYKVFAIYNGVQYSQTVTGVSLVSGAETVLTMNQSIQLVNGVQTMSGGIELVNGISDNDTTDNNKNVTFNLILPAPGKIVVAEEGTGTWCGWCPRGAVFMEYMENTFGDYFAGIAVHNGDPMVVADYDTPLGASFTGYPSALVDRGSAIDPSEIPSKFVTNIQIAPKAVLINGAIYDAGTNTLKVSIKTTAVSAFSGNYKIACVLTENGVKGTGSGWSQANYYSGGANGVMGGFELLPNPVPASQMTYNHVARAISPSFTGLPNAFGTASAGNEFVHNFTFTIPSTWKLDSLHIIGLFINASGKIDNASKSTYQQAVSNGYITGISIDETVSLNKDESGAVRLYPNPAGDFATLSIDVNHTSDITVSISRIDGSLISSRNYVSLSGTQELNLSLQSLLPGCYLISVIGNDFTKQLKLIKQ